jgi:hypothetical protein
MAIFRQGSIAMPFDPLANRPRAVVLSLALALVSAGCSSRNDTPPRDLGTEVDLGTTPDLGEPTDMNTEDVPAVVDAGDFDANFPAGTLTINGTLTELTATGPGSPVAGATVCVIQPAGGPCMVSAADGTFIATGIPENTQMLVELTAPTFHPALATVTTGTTDVTFGYFMIKRSTVGLLGTILGLSIDASKGQIFVQSGSSAGTVVSLSPASGTGPYYSDASSLPSRTLTSTSTSGAAIFANVAPGDYVVTFANPSVTCNPTGFSWAGTAPETTNVTVRADRITSTVALCL